MQFASAGGAGTAPPTLDTTSTFGLLSGVPRIARVSSTTKLTVMKQPGEVVQLVAEVIAARARET